MARRLAWCLGLWAILAAACGSNDESATELWCGGVCAAVARCGFQASTCPTSCATAVGRDVLGAWGLFLAMTEGTPGAATADVETIALAWKSDGIEIYEGPAGASAVVWRIDVGSPALAAQVASLLQGLPGVTVGTAGTWATIARASDAQLLTWAFATN